MVRIIVISGRMVRTTISRSHRLTLAVARRPRQQVTWRGPHIHNRRDGAPSFSHTYVFAGILGGIWLPSSAKGEFIHRGGPALACPHNYLFLRGTVDMVEVSISQPLDRDYCFSL